MPDLASRPNVLVVGDPHLGHFEPIVQFVRQLIGDQHVQQIGDLSQAENVVGTAAGLEPDVIVVLQAWPDQYSVADANLLISKFPFARLVCCYGPWCDSDGRNRSIWPLAVRVPTAAFAARFSQELALIAAPMQNSQRADQLLPLTASRSEIFAFDFDRAPTRALATISAAIVSPDRSWREMIAAALSKRGARLVSESAADGADVIVFDADPWNTQSALQLTALRQAHPKARLIACCGFPRRDLEAALRHSGADDVWFKLESLDSLAHQMADAVTRA